MRIRRLVVEGFGPFARRQEIDFAALEAAGLFLITGRTGSGKSSILDAVCFALYGGAPRYDGSKARLRSDHARPEDPTRVELEFDAAGDRWRVVRSPEYLRPKRRGDGFTTQREEAQVFRWEGDGWRGLAARAADLPEILEPVLQLTREQFLQVILLAQGRFQEFLRARSEERVGLLRALFGTQRFAAFEAELVQRTKGLEQRIAAADVDLVGDLARLGELADEDEAPPAERAAEVAAALRSMADDATAAGARTRSALAAADAAHAEQVRIGRLQRRRAEAMTSLALLAEQDAEIDRSRVRVAAALRALPATPVAARADRALRARSEAERELVAAERATGGGVADAADEAAALDGAIGALASALVEEAALPGLSRAVERAATDVRRAEDARAALAAEAGGIPAQRAEIAGVQRSALTAAAVLPEARASVQRLEQALGAARSAERLEQEVRTGDERHRAALTAERDAADRTLRLIEARAAGAAGLLAESLEDGSPCPVCGSVEHPAPASPGADRVDDADVTAAQDAQERARAARSDAADASAALRADLAAARSAAGGASVEDAERALGDARAAASTAEEAAAEAERAGSTLRSLDEQAAAAEARLERARAAIRERDAVLTAARSRSEEAEGRVEEARAGHDRVADRVELLRRRRDLLRILDVAARTVDSARAESEDAARLLDAALAEAGFESVDALRAAAVPAGEREVLELRVRRHDEARTTATAQLADPEVAAAPQEPADVDRAAAAKEQALDEQRTALQQEAELEARARQAAALQQRVRRALESTAEARAQLRVLAPLTSAVRGDNAKRMRLEAYVLAARLEQIVAAANLRLATMTDGRYTLRHDDSLAERGARSGLGLEVMDEHTGRARQIASLSGGETFLASLALALGLAEVVSEEAGGVRLDTLFIDEGFGSLDRQTLDTAMETLDSLRAGGRVVGLISHVEGMQEDIPAGLHVERDPDGSSSVRLRIPQGA